MQVDADSLGPRRAAPADRGSRPRTARPHGGGRGARVRTFSPHVVHFQAQQSRACSSRRGRSLARTRSPSTTCLAVQPRPAGQPPPARAVAGAGQGSGTWCSSTPRRCSRAADREQRRRGPVVVVPHGSEAPTAAPLPARPVAVALRRALPPAKGAEMRSSMHAACFWLGALMSGSRSPAPAVAAIRRCRMRVRFRARGRCSRGPAYRSCRVRRAAVSRGEPRAASRRWPSDTGAASSSVTRPRRRRRRDGAGASCRLAAQSTLARAIVDVVAPALPARAPRRWPRRGEELSWERARGRRLRVLTLRRPQFRPGMSAERSRPYALTVEPRFPTSSGCSRARRLSRAPSSSTTSSTRSSDIAAALLKRSRAGGGWVRSRRLPAASGPIPRRPATSWSAPASGRAIARARRRTLRAAWAASS